MSRLDTLHRARIIFAESTAGPATTLRKYALPHKTLQEALPLVDFHTRYDAIKLGFVQLPSTLELLCPDCPNYS